MTWHERLFCKLLTSIQQPSGSSVRYMLASSNSFITASSSGTLIHSMSSSSTLDLDLQDDHPNSPNTGISLPRPSVTKLSSSLPVKISAMCLPGVSASKVRRRLGTLACFLMTSEASTPSSADFLERHQWRSQHVAVADFLQLQSAIVLRW